MKAKVFDVRADHRFAQKAQNHNKEARNTDPTIVEAKKAQSESKLMVFEGAFADRILRMLSRVTALLFKLPFKKCFGTPAGCTDGFFGGACAHNWRAGRFSNGPRPGAKNNGLYPGQASHCSMTFIVFLLI